LHRPIFQRIKYHHEQIRQLSQRPCLRRPHELIRHQSRQLDDLDARGRRAIRTLHNLKLRELENRAATLAGLSPLSVLARGYTVSKIVSTGKVLNSIAQVEPGDDIVTQTNDGSLVSRVTSKKSDES